MQNCYGYKEQEVKGKPAVAVLKLSDTDPAVIRFREQMNTDEFVKADLVHYHKDGTPIYRGGNFFGNKR